MAPPAQMGRCIEPRPEECPANMDEVEWLIQKYHNRTKIKGVA